MSVTRLLLLLVCDCLGRPIDGAGLGMYFMRGEKCARRKDQSCAIGVAGKKLELRLPIGLCE